MAKQRKVAQIAPPVAVRAAATVAEPSRPANFEEYKQVAERVYAPEPEKPADQQRVVFVGTGSYAPTIGKRTYAVKFRPQTQYQVVATAPELIEWMRGKGFKELEA
jgi:hypothetical protein